MELNILYVVSLIAYGNAAPVNNRKQSKFEVDFDIWSADTAMIANDSNLTDYDPFEDMKPLLQGRKLTPHKSRVLHLFPVPLDGDCIANDGRRTGSCFNAYECRRKGGSPKGNCALGFGVCCVFVADCSQVITTNLTYLVSPNFPSTTPSNFTICKVKVTPLDMSISQLRLDFINFSLGQPNRKTGICDGDFLNVTGGRAGVFTLCGQNSGQHIYYDVDIQSLTNQSQRSDENDNMTTTVNPENGIEIIINLSTRFLPIRFWEIRIAQIPLSQKAPDGCLQYFTEPEGFVQTFNFADNGRHLANQHYKACIRQGVKMCSIIYQPCDEQSFRIGPTTTIPTLQNVTMETPTTLAPADSTTTTSPMPTTSTTPLMSTDSTQNNTVTTDSTTFDTEGSGDDVSPLPLATSSRPVRGGFDILSFLRRAFNLQSKKRQPKEFFRSCDDRITLPCIIEDFVGMGTFPICEPVHCGNQFCYSSSNPCRIESTVKPFYLGINFGNGLGKGSAEDNIGACIRYSQLQCM